MTACEHLSLAMELRALGGMPIFVPVAQILPDKGPLAVREVAAVDLFRSMVQLMAVTLHGPLGYCSACEGG